MNADKIKRLRYEAEVLRKHCGLRNWATAANLMIEISDELERLVKIEAAALAWRASRGTVQEGVAKANLMLATENSPCPTT